ncbi:MAG: imidazole glycerol phosphate synthase subunit HisH, partial [Anaerolineae bacterium]
MLENQPQRSIVIVDYGVGNLRSVQKALEYVGAPAVISADPATLGGGPNLFGQPAPGGSKTPTSWGLRKKPMASSEALLADAPAGVVLPGVGAFGDGMTELHRRGLVEPLRRWAVAGRPLLGICLGMQLLFDSSEEMGQHQGLGLLPGRVVRFPPGELKVPHVGWNRLRPVGQHPLLAGIPDGAYAYFVHSYYVDPVEPADVLATTDYGLDFASVVGRGQVWG